MSMLAMFSLGLPEFLIILAVVFLLLVVPLAILAVVLVVVFRKHKAQPPTGDAGRPPVAPPGAGSIP